MGASVRAAGAVDELQRFLGAATPGAWVQQAPEHLPELLIDHANCEKKAASTALSLMYRYTEHPALQQRLSPLAREELRHFEQVFDVLRQRDIPYVRLTPARYAAGLRACVASQEPLRLLDTLLVCAVVEARSAERFVALQPVLDGSLEAFYARLLESEARHYRLYLELADELFRDPAQRRERLRPILAADNELITADDTAFRFHSGPLAAGATAT